MGAVGGEAHVVDEVAGGHDAEAGVQDLVGPVDGLEVFFAALAVVAEHLEHVAAQVAVACQGLEAGECLRVVHEGVVALAALGDASPRGPSPDALVGGEEVVVLPDVGGDFVGVEPTDHRDALVVLVAVEHLLAEREERLRGHDVVFEHDDFVGQREGPLVGAEAGGVAALVVVEVLAVDVALPVNLVVADDASAGLDAGQVPLVARSVLIEEEA